MLAGDNIKVNLSQWEFNEKVALVFDDHVKKSVPLYLDGHELILKISDFFIRKNSICYDIGCSTGTLIRKLAEYHYSKEDTHFIGLEKEDAMLKESPHGTNQENWELICCDACEHSFKQSSLVISYYSLQFMQQEYRLQIIKKIYNSLQKGGAFILYEKVYASNAMFQDILNGTYLDFKLSNGYSFNEIHAKSLSIRGILLPNTTDDNINMLKDAGFKEVTIIMKYCNFEGIIAIK